MPFFFILTIVSAFGRENVAFLNLLIIPKMTLPVIYCITTTLRTWHPCTEHHLFNGAESTLPYSTLHIY